MLRFVRLYERHPRSVAASRRAAVLVLAMAAGGCSAGFEMPTLSYNGGPSSTSSVPIPREPVYSNRSGSLGDERTYGESSGQSYGQPYSQPYGQPYSSSSSDGGSYDRPYSPPYGRQGASQSPYQPSYQAPPRQEWRESNRGTPVSPVGERGVRVAGLPEANDGSAGTNSLPPPSQTPPPASIPYRSVETVPVTPPAPPRAAFDESSPPAVEGSAIEVASGDTLYALSKKHGVPVSELMRANNLSGPQLRVGQKLVLPSGRPALRRVASLPTAPAAEPAPPPAALPLPAALPPPLEQRPEPRLPHHEAGPIVPPLVETDPATPAATPAPVPVAIPAPATQTDAPADDSGWTGTYTVARGDSLYAIARKHNVRLNELERANKITDPRRVKPGAVLKVPRSGDAPAVASAPVASPPASADSDTPAVAPKIINARTRTAALGADAKSLPPAGATDAAPPAAPLASPETSPREAAAAPKAVATMAKFRWPARGKIISSFGNGQNDGINIALPRGTDIHAAEAGVVTYAGDGVQGYGNLLLIRHDGGWITAYAHNDSLAVKAGESVRRGQVVAKAGATGSVDTPQLRFEIRKGVKPVDPVQHLEN